MKYNWRIYFYHNAFNSPSLEKKFQPILHSSYDRAFCEKDYAKWYLLSTKKSNEIRGSDDSNNRSKVPDGDIYTDISRTKSLYSSR